MATVQVPVSLGGTNTAYTDGTGAFGMASNNGYGYSTHLIPMLAEIMAAMSQVVTYAGASSFSALAAASALSGAELFATLQSGVLKKATGQQLMTLIAGSTSLPGATVTTSLPLLDHTQTWNAGGVTFTGWKLNVTDTASAAASNLLNLLVAGVSKFAVRKDGALTSAGTINAAGNIDTTGLRVKSAYYLEAGNAIAGQGGNTRYITDTGANKWLVGLLGSGGAVDFSVYDSVNLRSLLTLSSASGDATFFANVATTGRGIFGTGTFGSASAANALDIFWDAALGGQIQTYLSKPLQLNRGGNYVSVGPDANPIHLDPSTKYIANYNTLSGVNYEQLALFWSGNVGHLFTQQAGTGVARELRIGTAGSAALAVYTNNLLRWTTAGATGHVTANGALNITTTGTAQFARLGLGITPAGVNYHQLAGGMKLQALATPGVPTVTPNGVTGATAYSYFIVAKDINGDRTLVGALGTTATGNAVLSGSDFNRITWAAVTGAVSYDVLKTDSDTLLGTVTATLLDDIGQATSAYTAPIRNETADLVVDGAIGVGPSTPVANGATFHSNKSGAVANHIAVGNGNNGVVVGVFTTGQPHISGYNTRQMTFGNYAIGGTYVPNLAFSSVGVATFGLAANPIQIDAGTKRIDDYNTLTDASNYERLSLFWSASVAHLLTQQAGTGVARELRIGTAGTAAMSVYTGNVLRWTTAGANGHITANGALNNTTTGDGASSLVITSGKTVATLPAATAGARSYVTDSTVAAAGNFGAIVAGGGVNASPVYGDGTNWRIG